MDASVQYRTEWRYIKWGTRSLNPPQSPPTTTPHTDSQWALWLQNPPSPTTWGSSGWNSAKRRGCLYSYEHVDPIIIPTTPASTSTGLTTYMSAQIAQSTKFSHHSELNSPQYICTYIGWHSTQQNVWPFLLCFYIFFSIYQIFSNGIVRHIYLQECADLPT